MSDELVRVLTKLQGLEFESVPLSQVPTGYILIHVRDHGDFYADPAGLRSAGTVHPPFTEATRAELQKQYDILARAGIEYVAERTLDMWVDGFRKDRTPWTEMTVWDLVAAGLQKFTGHTKGNKKRRVLQRNDVFRILLAVMNGAPEVQSKGTFQPLNTLSAKQVAGSCLFSTPEIGLIIWLGSSFNDQSFGSPRSVKVRTLFVTVPALACYDLHAPQEAFPSNR